MDVKNKLKSFLLQRKSSWENQEHGQLPDATAGTNLPNPSNETTRCQSSKLSKEEPRKDNTMTKKPPSNIKNAEPPISRKRQSEETTLSLFQEIMGLLKEKRQKFCTRELENSVDINPSKYLEITRTVSDFNAEDPNGPGPYSGARIVVKDDGVAYFQANQGKKQDIMSVCDGEHLDRVQMQLCLEKMDPDWHACAGIPIAEYESASQNIGYTPKGFTHEKSPYNSIFSIKCERWFQIKRPKSYQKSSNDTYACGNCKRFLLHVKDLNKKNTFTEEQKKERVKPSSHCPIQLLSPNSKKRRLENARAQRKCDAEKLTRLRGRIKEYEMSLEEEQNEEMISVVNILNTKYRDEVDKLINADNVGAETRQVLEEIWNHDCKDRNDFYSDQTKNLSGKHNGNRWSTITYRIALAVFHRSPAAYEALKSFKIIQLPSVSSLKQFSSKRFHTAGITDDTHEYIEGEQRKYKQYAAELVRRGRLRPLNLGTLIFDEVRVTGKVKWSPHSQELYGLEMTDDEFCRLHDIYEALNPDKIPEPAHYMLQTLWRDITSDFDVIGPYFASKESLKHRFIIACILETMRLFHSYDFKVNGLVGDGASSNLTAFKILCTGKTGAFTKGQGLDPHKIKAWFQNPYAPELNVYCIICPSHQLKNQVNGLYQSRPGGTKAFKLEPQKPIFGWEAIRQLWAREADRRQKNLLTVVPRLKKEYITRDPWIKLAVLPAKIMQQKPVLSELRQHIATHPQDEEMVSQSRAYLQACNQIFEEGFLSHRGIYDMNSPVLQSINEGYQFFVNWYNALDGPGFHPTSPVERKFIAWQTWDLLRFCVYGFNAFCKDFLTAHPGYYVMPLKWNGSAVETLFSQLRWIAGGKLDSTNYATAREGMLVKRDIHGHKCAAAARGYRDVPLYIRNTQLTRKN